MVNSYNILPHHHCPSYFNDIISLKLFNDFINPIAIEKGNQSNLLLDSLLTFSENGSKGKREYSYDEFLRVSNYIIYYWQSNQWEIGLRISNTYDTDGNIKNIFHEFWNGNEWLADMLETYAYNSAGNKIHYLVELWDYTQWLNSFQGIYTYDSNSNLVNLLHQDWEGSVWVNSSLSFYTYNSQGYMDSLLIQQWNGNSWLNVILVIYDYDAQWNRISAFVEIWDGFKWVQYLNFRLSYDSSGNLVLGIGEIWDGIQWNNDNRFSYRYNNDNYCIYGLQEYWINNEWIPGDGGLIFTNPDGVTVAVITSELFAYYSEVTSVVEDDNFLKNEYTLFQNYPNPFNPITTLKYMIPSDGFVRLKVYDILGKEISTLVNEEQNKGYYEVDFDAKNLSSGVYIYRIESGSFTDSKLMILQK